MTKDPAFLFYSSDFLTGTVFLTYHEKGQYIHILCLLHQHGGCLSQESLEICVGKIEKNVLKKLQKNKHGLYSKRLYDEMQKRKNYSISRRKNRLGKKKNKNTCNSYDVHMENENENVNIDIKGSFTNHIKEIWDYFLLKTEKNYKLSKERKDLILKRLKEGYTLEQLRSAIDNFVQDDWPGRADHMDLIYCIGKQRGKADNLEKWLNKEEKVRVFK